MTSTLTAFSILCLPPPLFWKIHPPPKVVRYPGKQEEEVGDFREIFITFDGL